MKILIVDDQTLMRVAARMLLERDGFDEIRQIAPPAKIIFFTVHDGRQVAEPAPNSPHTETTHRGRPGGVSA